MSTQTSEISLPHSCRESARNLAAQVPVESIQFIDASQLCGDIADRWQLMRQRNANLASPYYDIEFTKSVARVRSDVEIAIIKNAAEEIVNFVPFQRVGEFHAEPVGGRLNDIHGLIGLHSDEQLKLLTNVMKSAGLKSFGFHALNEDSPAKNKFVFREIDSYFIDLRNGWEAYQQWNRAQSKTIKRQGQKTRAMIRELGPLRFEFDCPDADMLERLIELKRAKYQRTKTFDILSVEWAANLIREVSVVNKPGFQGLLSTLFAGEKLVAVHFGMKTDKLLHYWFPVYANEYSKYSPGTELILQVAQEASRQGITKVDFGYGDDPYKIKFCNGREKLCCGRITASKLAFSLARKRYEIRQKLKNIPMKSAAKAMLRRVFPGFGQWNFK